MGGGLKENGFNVRFSPFCGNLNTYLQLSDIEAQTFPPNQGNYESEQLITHLLKARSDKKTLFVEYYWNETIYEQLYLKINISDLQKAKAKIQTYFFLEKYDKIEKIIIKKRSYNFRLQNILHTNIYIHI